MTIIRGAEYQQTASKRPSSINSQTHLSQPFDLESTLFRAGLAPNMHIRDGDDNSSGQVRTSSTVRRLKRVEDGHQPTAGPTRKKLKTKKVGEKISPLGFECYFVSSGITSPSSSSAFPKLIYPSITSHCGSLTETIQTRPFGQVS